MERHLGRISVSGRKAAEALGYPGGDIVFAQMGHRDVLFTIEHESMPAVGPGEMVPVVVCEEDGA